MKRILIAALIGILFLIVVSPVQAVTPVFPWKSCDARTNSFGSVATNACDGDSTTNWIGVSPDAMGEWIRGNLTPLASQYQILGLRIKWQLLDDNSSNIAIESWNGAFWLDRLTGQSGSANGFVKTYYFNASFTTTALRVIQYTGQNAKGMGIYELILILSPAPATQDWLTVYAMFFIATVFTILGFWRIRQGSFVDGFICVLSAFILLIFLAFQLWQFTGGNAVVSSFTFTLGVSIFTIGLVMRMGDRK